MKLLLSRSAPIILILALIGGCAVTAKDLGAKNILAGPENPLNIDRYAIKNSDLVEIIIESTNELGWVKSELHKDVYFVDENGRAGWKFKTQNSISSEFLSAWKSVSPDEKTDEMTFIKIRTPMSAFSFGVEIYIGVSSFDGKSTVKYSASTTQIVEKNKLQEYLTKIITLVNKKAGTKLQST